MTAATIIVAREDLSIRDAPEIPPSRTKADEKIEARFFKLVRDSRPDVIVLDVSRDRSRAVAAIVRIRRRCAVPIIISCDRLDSSVDEYRRAGAVDCMVKPLDIRLLNAKLGQIIGTTRRAARQPPTSPLDLPQWRV